MIRKKKRPNITLENGCPAEFKTEWELAMNKKAKRFRMMEEIDILIYELQQTKWPGVKGQREEIHKRMKKYWINFVYGFDDISWLTLEQTEDFKSFIIKVIETERKKRSLPIYNS